MDANLPKIIFYEKPGCASNRTQKELLVRIGLQLDVRNLLTQAWTAEQLLAFFGELPVEQWFNPSAPSVKSGEIIPAEITASAALSAMIDNPILIRRPLMHWGDYYQAGFDLPRLMANLPPVAALQDQISLKDFNLSQAEACSASGRKNHCSTPVNTGVAYE